MQILTVSKLNSKIILGHLQINWLSFETNKMYLKYLKKRIEFTVENRKFEFNSLLQCCNTT